MLTRMRLGLLGLTTLASALVLACTQDAARGEGWRLTLRHPLPAKVETPVVAEVSAVDPGRRL